MALATGSAIDAFDTQIEVTVASPSAITTGAFSVQADVNSWTNTDDAPLAHFLLICQLATMPDAGSSITLYARQLNIESTNDAPQPDTSYEHTRIADFPIDDGSSTATDMYLLVHGIKLPNIETAQGYEFYLKNNSTQTITSAWDLFITPASFNAA